MCSRTRFLAIGLMATLALLLVACSSETTVTLYDGEEWVVENVSRVDLAMLPEVSVGGDLIPELGIGLSVDVDTGAWSKDLLESQLDQLAGYYRSQGVEVTWSSRPAGSGETAYTIHLEGTGWERLCTVALTGTHASVVNLGDDQVRFTMDVPVDQSGFGYMVDNTVHLRGRQIVDGNAHQVRGGQATWQNPQGTMWATVALARPFDLGSPWVVGGAVAAGVVAVTTAVILAVRSSVPVRYRPRRPGPPRRPLPRRSAVRRRPRPPRRP